MQDEKSFPGYTNIYACTVDCGKRRLILHTSRLAHPPGDQPQKIDYIDLIFEGLLAHVLENDLEVNVLSGVDDYDIDQLVADHAVRFETSWKNDWPPIQYNGELKVLAEKLKSASVRGFAVRSGYGLRGWILAETLRRRIRDRRPDFING